MWTTRVLNFCQNIWVGPIFGVVIAILMQGELGDVQSNTLGITLWVALWWMFEPVPIAIASLLPFVLFPMTGVLSNKEIAHAYGHWLILLLMGGFMLSTMIERSRLHERFAIQMMSVVGVQSPTRLLLGIMLATALMSGWISNTATTLIVLPIVLAVSDLAGSAKNASIFVLGLAYAASIGGMSTPIGTPPNIVLIGVLEQSTGVTIGFLDWMRFAVPISLVLLGVTWLVLSKSLVTQDGTVTLPSIQPMSTEQWRVLMVFGIVVMLWVFRTQPYDGWTGWFPDMRIGDDTIALFGVVLAFMIPSGVDNQRLLDWETAKDIPWGLLLLFGGGIAIATAFKESGLSLLIGEQLLGLQHLPMIVMIGGLCLGVTFLTEVTSNTATTTLLMPILVAAGMASDVDVRLWMVPAALSASCAFMLPVATAPNAIVFGSGRVTVGQMTRMGLRVNLLGVVVITLGAILLL